MCSVQGVSQKHFLFHTGNLQEFCKCHVMREGSYQFLSMRSDGWKLSTTRNILLLLKRLTSHIIVVSEGMYCMQLLSFQVSPRVFAEMKDHHVTSRLSASVVGCSLHGKMMLYCILYTICSFLIFIFRSINDSL